MEAKSQRITLEPRRSELQTVLLGADQKGLGGDCELPFGYGEQL